MAEIVVGYDGTPGAREALRVALETAGALGDKVVIVFGAHISRLGGEVLDYAKTVHERAEEALRHGVHQAQAAGVEVETLVAEGDPADVLAQTATQREARMIVVGSYGEHPIKGAILGATPHKLLHIAEVPVLVVPAAGG